MRRSNSSLWEEQDLQLTATNCRSLCLLMREPSAAAFASSAWRCGVPGCRTQMLGVMPQTKRMGGLNVSMIAPCGIDCAECSIYRAANSPAEAAKLAERRRAAGHEQAIPGWFRCQGCHGAEGLLWSGGCQIRRCCCSERHHEDCSLCDAFPCETITSFEDDGDKHHRAAVQRLRVRRQMMSNRDRQS